VKQNSSSIDLLYPETKKAAMSSFFCLHFLYYILYYFLYYIFNVIMREIMLIEPS